MRALHRLFASLFLLLLCTLCDTVPDDYVQNARALLASSRIGRPRLTLEFANSLFLPRRHPHLLLEFVAVLKPLSV
eukprot:5067301-Alexandrium_andersonii.AAC.1